MADRKKDVFYEAVEKWEKEHCMMIPFEAKIATYFFDYAYDNQQEKIKTLQQEVKKLTELIELLPEG